MHGKWEGYMNEINPVEAGVGFYLDFNRKDSTTRTSKRKTKSTRLGVGRGKKPHKSSTEENTQTHTHKYTRELNRWCLGRPSSVRDSLRSAIRTGRVLVTPHQRRAWFMFGQFACPMPPSRRMMGVLSEPTPGYSVVPYNYNMRNGCGLKTKKHNNVAGEMDKG